MYEWEKQLRSGYLSFSRADLVQSVAEGGQNTAAYKLMIEATETNALYKTRSGKSVNEIYPLTATAVKEMSLKLKEAEAAADNPNDETFQYRLKELKRIAWWSAKRHSTYSWMIIVGGLLWALFYLASPFVLSGPDYGKWKAQVEAWSDTPPNYTIEEAKKAYSRNNDIYRTATNYKLYHLHLIIEKYDKAVHNYENTAETLRYGTLSEKDKEIYSHNLEIEATAIENVKAEFNVAAAQTVEQWQQKALSEVGGGAKDEKDRNMMFYLTVAYFILITVLYILTNRPRGYMLSRQRSTARVTGGVLNVFFGILTWLGISGARMGWTDPDKIVTIFWSDGSVTKHLLASDLINGSALFKIGFYVAALTFLMFGSAYLLPILTIIGFFINIDRK